MRDSQNHSGNIFNSREPAMRYVLQRKHRRILIADLTR